MTTESRQIRIDDYDYSLPDGRIAKYPLPQRDASRLLVYRAEGGIGEAIFRDIKDYLPDNSLMVFNNTRVIRARMVFVKDTGAEVEIFCLEPAEPSDYALAFSRTESSSWHCLVGNLRRWKNGDLHKQISINERQITLTAHLVHSTADTHLIRFTWDDSPATFADIIESAGVLPIPPYLNRKTQSSDLADYQTVYSKEKGSVAAPTAGLHFTEGLLSALDDAGIIRRELTLHVGAGTFKPVTKPVIADHTMHTEHFSAPRLLIEKLLDPHPVIAVGTTSVRTLESLYHIGIMLANSKKEPCDLHVGQWTPYSRDDDSISTNQALRNVLDYLDRHHTDRLIASTQIMIVPGYRFRVVDGMVTNFHQPRSTLLLLVSAFVGQDRWRSIYNYALENGFRFLSYGDSSLLLTGPTHFNLKSSIPV
ncbi:MAG: S-adenosylmethionine:tRNA ribosyltransferase-isomerase [Tannerellaceae bacterium]|jgi:S-adenosylmethionine:tRNA ribosyltransferase-isomerase|nr:S-adenosylmethionine:tRNA ribosyltransferase-isomerase [Tannerellaceae bacterium]